mgnify:CR=1 FL=1
MTTISTALTVTDTVGDGGTVRWDRDSQELCDVIGAWYDMSAAAGDDGGTIGDVVDAIDAGIAACEPTDALEALLGITIDLADDSEDVDL